MMLSMQEVVPGETEWRCQNKQCRRRFAEYINGCPCCESGEAGGSHAVRLEPVQPASASEGKPC